MDEHVFISEIYKMLSELNMNVAKLTTGQALLTQNQEQVVMPCLDMLKAKVVVGNGHPPLCTTVDNHETRLTTLEVCKKEARDTKFRRIDIWIAIGMLVCAMGEIYIISRHGL